MATPQEIEQLLNKVQKANEELKETVQQAHIARRDLLADFKKHKEQIAETIVKEVTSQVGELSADAGAEMKTKVAATIDQITADWRRALKLDA